MAYIGAEPVPGQNREVDDISSGFNGSATAFTLQVSSVNVSPESANNILVNLGGVMQNPGTDYTIAASTITFTTAPAAGLSFFGLILGAGINTATVADGVITTAKLEDGAVNNAKVNASAAIAGTKISPNFGSQNIVTTGSITGNDLEIDSGTLSVDATNNRVGIGITTPQVLMHLNGTGARFQLTDSTTGTASGDGVIMGLNGSQDFFVNNRESSKNLLFFNGDTERMRIDSNGNIAIGTDTSEIDNSHHIVTIAGRANNGAGGISFVDTSSNVDAFIFADTGNLFINADYDNATGSSSIRFRVDGSSEKMRIDSSGNLAVGTTDMTGRIHARVNAASSTNFANDNAAVASGSQFIHISNSNTGGNEQAGFVMNASGSASAIGAIYMHKTNSYLGAMVFRMRTNANTSASRMEIDSQGNIGAPNGTNIYNASDVRLKKNVVDLDKGLSAIKSLRPVSFNWIDGFCDKEKDTLYGFIAQEVETVDRNLIQEFGNGSVTVEGQTINDALRVNEKFIIPMLVKAVQELEAKVAALEAA